jgi:tetratricopeptide (TPR) repeat protein
MEEFVRRDGDDQLSFRNGLLRDSAYDGLSYRHRRELHSRAGDSILQMASVRGEDHSERLSFHYFHAQRHQEAWSHSLVAAERAKAVYANVDAAEFYERALLAGRRLPQVSPKDLSDVHEALGDAKNRTGAYSEAAAAYRSSRRLVADDAVAEARIVLKLARVQGWLDRYANALRWISRGLRILEGVEGAEAAHQRSELLTWYARFCQEAGHHARAIKWCTLAVAQAEAAGAKVALAEALRVIDWAKMELGQLEQPVNTERALAIYEERDDLPALADTFSVLGIYAYFRGEWGEALDLYRRGEAFNRRTGNAVKTAFQVLNIGEIALDQGRFDEAEQAFDTAYRTWRAAGYRSGTAYVKCNLARLAAGRGHYDEALRLFEESVAESRDIGSHSEALEAQARMAECLLLSGDHTAALELADKALAQSRTLGGVPAQIPLIQRVRGAALARSGEPALAMEALEQSLQAARTRRAGYEAALTMRVMAQCGTDPADDRHAELERDAASMLSKLGVVWTPDLLNPVVMASERPT